MSRSKKLFVSLTLCFTILFISVMLPASSIHALDSLSFIILSKYKASLDIGDDFYLIAITSNGKMPTWKSSNSKVASVNTYGLVTAKKAGTATITAKIKNAEASCQVTVVKTQINLNKSSLTLERNGTAKLTATTSNQSEVTWKSSRTSIATVDENGKVTAIKPGEATITAKADQSTTTCKVTVKQPTVILNKTKLVLYRKQTAKLSASVSSGVNPLWKSNKKGVATVDQNGIVTGVKHGTAIITAVVDGVSKSCEVIVQQPAIQLSAQELTLREGSSHKLTAAVSSGNSPVWSSSNSSVATVDSIGTITAVSKGRAYIYASEDGIKVRCTVYVTKK